MRLIDFKLSTADLWQGLPLYLETSKHARIAINALQLHDHQLILIPAARQHPLTLDQFNARTRQIGGQTQLYVQANPTPLRLFGYRIENQQLLLG
ncbi:hypothetical protein [Lactiplantibacillus modestisalitolerans]|uniref:Uncharacterized protein n=1 Tax=Lactiplantibacillus modestisalitolerans TaxID=1457219 RepID=A0ABV5WT82_9LACO|nr:hypothetical protein [Lactiplantibacillus modestisalitolerans]